MCHSSRSQMEYKNIIIYIGVLCLLIAKTYSYQRCELRPTGVNKPPMSNADGRFIIDITGNPKSYVPFQFYTVSVKLNPTSPIRRTFRQFVLMVESVADRNDVAPRVGNLHLNEETKARFSEKCPNTVIQSSSSAKTEVKLLWQAPPPNSGCVIFKAAVAETREIWYQAGEDDRHLIVELCEETVEDKNRPPVILKQCCACDEATYEIAFEGTWTRNTHPKDFPQDLFSTKFSDVIGASHSYDHAFWEYAGIASDGLKLLAEEGNTTGIEDELKDMNEDVRTIIKARSLTYPDITGTTYAIFRVDSHSHLISVASKITPSPDWIVGVSNFELCTTNCSWIEQKTIDLYPWDAGTDDGITYLSKSPRLVRQQIRRIKSNSPSDERSPFFDEDGEEMNPIAKLHLTRLRLFKKDCDPSQHQPAEEGNDEEPPRQCATTEWSDWSACSGICEEGDKYRSRSYINPDDQYICDEKLVETKSCFIHTPKCPNDENGMDEFKEVNAEDPRCELSEWSEWSSCSAICGKGTRTRDRHFKNRLYAQDCSQNDEIELQENEECIGEMEDCEEEEQTELCPGTKWGSWSACNATCESDGGKGYKERYVLVIDEEMQSSCTNSKYREVVECTAPCDEEEDLSPFDPLKTDDQISEFPDVILQESKGPVIDCRVTKWSLWGPCILPGNRPCGNGYREKTRRIKIHERNGGKACPKRLRLTRRCHIPCEGEDDNDAVDNVDHKESPEVVDCVMGPWSSWSPCSAQCGSSSVRIRTRNIRVKPSENGEPCGHRVEYRNCPLPVACDGGVPKL